MGVDKNNLYNEPNHLLLYNDSHALNILSANDRMALIDVSIRYFSELYPLLKLLAVTGTTQDWYSLPTDWEDGFSSVANIEYPIEGTPPTYISNLDYEIALMSDNAYYLRFSANNPGLDNVFWLRYYIRYTFESTGESSIPEAFQSALAYLVCSTWCEAFSAHFASKSDPSLAEAEAIQYTSRVEEYAGRARWYKQQFRKYFKREETGSYGSMSFVQNPTWDRTDD